MLNQQTLHKLYVMRLAGDAFRSNWTATGGLSFEERSACCGPPMSWKEDRAWPGAAQLAAEGRGRGEDIDYRTPRGLDRALVRSLAAESSG